jgi:antitoxin CptB
MSESDRVRWRCRRGMLELDLILLRFVDEQYPQLSLTEQQAFEALLQLQDDELLEMISGGGTSRAEKFASLIERLRQC